MNIFCNFLQRDLGVKVFINIKQRTFDDLVVFGWNIVKHTFRKCFYDFLQFVTQSIHCLDRLEILQKMIVQFQNAVCRSSPLDGSTGQQRAEFDGARFYNFQTVPLGKKYISKQVIENGVSGAYITFLYLIDQFFFFFIRIGICLDIFGFIALDGFTDPGLLKQFFVIF